MRNEENIAEFESGGSLRPLCRTTRVDSRGPESPARVTRTSVNVTTPIKNEVASRTGQIRSSSGVTETKNEANANTKPTRVNKEKKIVSEVSFRGAEKDSGNQSTRKSGSNSSTLESPATGARRKLVISGQQIRDKAPNISVSPLNEISEKEEEEKGKEAAGKLKESLTARMGTQTKSSSSKNIPKIGESPVAKKCPIAPQKKRSSLDGTVKISPSEASSGWPVRKTPTKSSSMKLLSKIVTSPAAKKNAVVFQKKKSSIDEMENQAPSEVPSFQSKILAANSKELCTGPAGCDSSDAPEKQESIEAAKRETCANRTAKNSPTPAKSWYQKDLCPEKPESASEEIALKDSKTTNKQTDETHFPTVAIEEIDPEKRIAQVSSESRASIEPFESNVLPAMEIIAEVTDIPVKFSKDRFATFSEGRSKSKSVKIQPQAEENDRNAKPVDVQGSSNHRESSNSLKSQTVQVFTENAKINQAKPKDKGSSESNPPDEITSMKKALFKGTVAATRTLNEKTGSKDCYSSSETFKSALSPETGLSLNTERIFSKSPRGESSIDILKAVELEPTTSAVVDKGGKGGREAGSLVKITFSRASQKQDSRGDSPDFSATSFESIKKVMPTETESHLEEMEPLIKRTSSVFVASNGTDNSENELLKSEDVVFPSADSMASKQTSTTSEKKQGTSSQQSGSGRGGSEKETDPSRKRTGKDLSRHAIKKPKFTESHSSEIQNIPSQVYSVVLCSVPKRAVEEDVRGALENLGLRDISKIEKKGNVWVVEFLTEESFLEASECYEKIKILGFRVFLLLVGSGTLSNDAIESINRASTQLEENGSELFSLRPTTRVYNAITVGAPLKGEEALKAAAERGLIEVSYPEKLYRAIISLVPTNVSKKQIQDNLEAQNFTTITEILRAIPRPDSRENVMKVCVTFKSKKVKEAIKEGRMFKIGGHDVKVKMLKEIDTFDYS